MAKLRLTDLEKAECQAAENRSAAETSKMTFGEALAVCRQRLHTSAGLKRRTSHWHGGALAMKVYRHLRDQHSVAMAQRVSLTATQPENVNALGGAITSKRFV